MSGQSSLGQMNHLGQGLEKKRSPWEKFHIDLPLLFAILVIIGFGLMVLYSATDGNQAELQRQVTFIGLALFAMIIVAQIDVRVMRRWVLWMYLGTVALLTAVLFYGLESNGAQRWLDFPGLPPFQPSEIMKIVLPLSIASYLSKRAIPPKLQHIFWALVIVGLPVGLIAIEPDFGTSLLIAASGIFVILLAGIRWRLVFAALGLALVSLVPIWFFYFSDYQKGRVITYLNPESDPLGAGWNIIQSKTAIGSGGIYGKGWLNGVQSRLDFLPEGQTDFILAVMAEEFGLVGILFLLGLYFVIISRGLYISAVAHDTFSRLLAGSITLTFFVYVFVNMGMVTGLLPVVGVPLPLVSLGGTSIVTLMIGFGILMSIHTHGKESLRYPV